MERSPVEIGLMHSASLALANRAIAGITEDYDPQTGRWPRVRHNQHHTIEVVDSTVMLSEDAYRNGRITEWDIALNRIAAAFHDRFYIRGRSDCEAISAQLAIAEMDEFDVFIDADKEAVERRIMATVMQSYFPRLLQSADIERDYSEGIICDADFSLFGKAAVPFIKDSVLEFRELVLAGHTKGIMQFFFNEEILLRNHRWYTEEAAAHYNNMLANIAAVKNFRDSLAVQ